MVVWGKSPSSGWLACLIGVNPNESVLDRWSIVEDGTGDSRLTASWNLLSELETTFGKIHGAIATRDGGSSESSWKARCLS
jgi:hypothetical protein